MISVQRCVVLAIVALAIQGSSILGFPTLASAHPSKTAIASVTAAHHPMHRISRLKRLRPHR